MLGCDIVYIPRLQKTIERSGQNFLDKIFHASECAKATIEHLAGIMAAKEAAMKALGLAPGNWLKLCVEYNKDGAPLLYFFDDKQRTLPVSISHDGDYAFAVVFSHTL